MAYLLTEENIKHCTLGFLKTYYKNNSSRGFGVAEAKLDMVTADGVVADGFLKFSVKEEGEENLIKPKKGELPKMEPRESSSSFLATFEATSQDTAEEIQYKVQNTLLALDGLAIAFLVAAGSYGFNYLKNQFTLNDLGFIKFWIGFLAVLMASLIGYILIFRFFPRYRYIYAIAQFRRYFADEQWISYGEDVFEHPENKYLVELKKQCMKKGLGLICVNQQLIPTLIMTPARDMAGGTGKRIKEFFSSTTTITKKRFKWLKLPKWLQKRLPSFNLEKTISIPLETTTDYMRFTRSYWKQALLILFSIGVMWEIYNEELKNPNIVYLDGTEYEQTVFEQTKDNKPEPHATFLDLETGARKKIVNPKTSIPPSAEYVDPVIKPTPPKRKKPATPNEFIEKGVIVAANSEDVIAYSCGRLARVKGEIYLVQIQTALTYKEALNAVKSFSKQGFKVNALSLSCFYKNKRQYVIYVDDIFPSKVEAEKRKHSFHKLMIAKKIDLEEPLIRVMRRMK